MTSVFMRDTQGGFDREEQAVWECLAPPGTAGAKEGGLSWSLQRGRGPAGNLLSDFCPPELWGNKLLCFKPPVCGNLSRQPQHADTSAPTIPPATLSSAAVFAGGVEGLLASQLLACLQPLQQQPSSGTQDPSPAARPHRELEGQAAALLAPGPRSSCCANSPPRPPAGPSAHLSS